MRTEPGATEPHRSHRAVPRQAVADRDLGLLRIGRVNRWLVAGAIGMTGFVSTVAALAHPGSSRRNAQASSSGAATQAPSSSSAGASGSSAGSNDPNAGSTDPNAGSADPNSGYGDPNAGYGDQSAVPSDPSQGQPVAPSAVPQADPNAGLPPAATSGGS